MIYRRVKNETSCDEVYKSSVVRLRVVVLAYLVLVHLLLIRCAPHSKLSSWLQSHLGASAGHQELTQHYDDMLSYHLRMDENIPDGGVIFIGDSLIQSMYVAAIAHPAVNYGIGNDTTVGVLARLPRYTSLQRASTIVIAIGINDLKWRSNEAIIANYERITQLLPGSVPIVFSAILPVDEKARTTLVGRNTRKDTLNMYVRHLCARLQHCVFVDAGLTLSDHSANLSAQFHVGDGIHLNTQGNALWASYLRQGVLAAQQQRSDLHKSPSVAVQSLR